MKLPASVLQTMRLGVSTAVLAVAACDAPSAQVEADPVTAEESAWSVDAPEATPAATAAELRASFARPVAPAPSRSAELAEPESLQSREPAPRELQASVAGSRIRTSESAPVQFAKPKPRRVAARRSPRSATPKGAWTCGPCGRG